MTLFSKINLKQFETLNYIVNNTDIAHITCIIKCIIQSDKLETPYYMDTEISLSHCIENEEKGIVHAMDVFKHHRMYNLNEKTYIKLQKSMIDTFSNEHEKTLETDFSKNKQIIEIRTMNASKLKKILEKYETFFKQVDALI